MPYILISKQYYKRLKYSKNSIIQIEFFKNFSFLKNLFYVPLLIFEIKLYLRPHLCLSQAVSFFDLYLVHSVYSPDQTKSHIEAEAEAEAHA